MALFYEFAAPAGVFIVRSAADLAGPLALYAGAWPWRAIPGGSVADHAVDVDVAAGAGGGWALSVVAAPALRNEAGSLLEAAGAVIDVLTRLVLERLGPFADLHAGAALVDGGLVVMPGPSQAGKSTLALQLAVRGHALAGDDRILIGPLAAEDRGDEESNDIQGVALGLNARARLPVHAAAGQRFAAFVADRRLGAPMAPAGLGFVAPRAGEAMGFGDRAAIAAFVLPQREEGGGIRLEPAPPSLTMRALLEQMHAPHLPAGLLVAAARALAGGRPGYVLRFDDSAAGAAAIEKAMREGGANRK